MCELWSGSSLGARKLFQPNLCVSRRFPGGTKKMAKFLFYCYGLSASTRTGNLSNTCLEHYRLTNLLCEDSINFLQSNIHTEAVKY